MSRIIDFQSDTGDKIGKAEVCQAIFLVAIIGGLVACACLRGSQEIKKKINKYPNQAKAIQGEILKINPFLNHQKQ